MTRGSTLIYHFIENLLPDALSRFPANQGFQPVAPTL